MTKLNLDPVRIRIRNIDDNLGCLVFLNIAWNWAHLVYCIVGEYAISRGLFFCFVKMDKKNGEVLFVYAY